MKIALSNYRAETGKIAQGDIDAWREFNGSFRNVDISPEELMARIKQGYAYTAAHGRYRHSNNFICAQHLALDMDTQDERSSIAVLTADPFISQYAAFIHTTPSHTAEKPKARVVFVLDRPIHNAGKYAELMTALVSRFEIADKACKDAARFFYGAKDCQTAWLGNTLILEDAAKELVSPYRDKLEAQRLKAEQAAKNRVVVSSEEIPERVLQKHSQSLLDRVRNAPDGEKYITLRDTAITFGGYVAGGYYPRIDATNWLQGAIRSNGNNVQDLQAAFRTIEESVAYGMARPLHFELNGQKNDDLDGINPPLTPAQRAQVQRIISRDLWQAYHDGMSQAQREHWHKCGFDDSLVDYFNLGYCKRRVDEETGEILEDALTVPFANADGQVVNIEYRHEDGRITYETEQPAIYYIERTDSPLLLWPDTVTALRSYLHFGSLPYTFCGLPQLPLDNDMVSGTAVVILEPETETAGRRLKRLDARFVRLPMAAKEMVRRGIDKNTLYWYIQQARGV